jgi:Phosphotransferase enzyme family
MHLRQRDLPVSRPADGLPPGPHEHLGQIVTFWDQVPLADGQPGIAQAATLLRFCHAALASLELGSTFDLGGEAVQILCVTPERRFVAGERTLLVRAAAELFEVLWQWDGPVQPLHGDAWLGNLIPSAPSPVWCDFEDAHIGSPLWDLACLIAPAQVLGNGELAADAALGGYGSAVDADDLDRFVAARVLHQAIWSAFVNTPGPSPGRLARLRWLEARLRHREGYPAGGAPAAPRASSRNRR